MDSSEALFFSSVFSVKSSSLPALKNELRSLLARYVDHAEVAEGDRVVEVIAALI